METDSTLVRRLTTFVAFALAALSLLAFAVGSVALFEAGRHWLGLPGMMAATLPALIDVGLVLLSIASLAAAARNESRWVLQTAVGVLVAVSMAVQVLHVLNLDNGAEITERIGGSVLGALAPALLWVSSYALERSLFGGSVAREAARAAAAAKLATAEAATANRVALAAVKAARPKPTTRPANPAARRPATAIPEATRELAISRVIAGDSQRAVARDLQISRGAIQTWLREPA